MGVEIIETDTFTELQAWNALVDNQRKEILTLGGIGYGIFLGIANRLPSIESQPKEHWSYLSEDQIEFVSVGDHEKLSLDDESLANSVFSVFGIKPPFRIGIFDIKDRPGRKCARSAQIMIKSLHGDKFSECVGMRIGYKHESSDGQLMSPEIVCRAANLDASNTRRIEKTSELDLLLAANCLAELYVKRIKTEDTQTAS